MKKATQMLSLEEEQVLIYRAQMHGDVKARDELVLAHRGFVRKIAYTYTTKNATLDTDDFFQAGILGLHDALQRFDPAKGARFATYARFWINQKILLECGGVRSIGFHPKHNPMLDAS